MPNPSYPRRRRTRFAAGWHDCYYDAMLRVALKMSARDRARVKDDTKVSAQPDDRAMVSRPARV